MPALAPLGEIGWSEAKRIGLRIRAGVKIQIPIQLVIVVRPVAREQCARIEIDDICLEGETDVRLGPAALKLSVASESEDIIPHDVRFAVVLVKATVGSAIDDVVLGEDAAAAFVEVNSPAAIT